MRKKARAAKKAPANVQPMPIPAAWPLVMLAFWLEAEAAGKVAVEFASAAVLEIVDDVAVGGNVEEMLLAWVEVVDPSVWDPSLSIEGEDGAIGLKLIAIVGV
jgi:hypothetical protein